MDKIYLTGYFGGKITHLKEILPSIPAHHLYCDVFGGMMPILLNKPKSKIEIYNDINGRLVNLWKQIQADYRYLQLSCEMSIQSRQLFIESLKQTDDPKDDAYQFLYSIVRSFSGLGKTFLGIQNRHKDIRELSFRLKPIHTRIFEIIIENQDFKILLDRIENEVSVCKNTQKFYYVDPPYEKGGNYYEKISGNESHWSKENLDQLIQILDKTQCKFMISYDQDISSQFTRKDLIVKSYSKKTYAGSNTKKKLSNRKEYLIMNYQTGLQRYL